MTNTLPRGGWRPTIHALLSSLLAGPKGVAVFDWDDTVIEGDLSRQVMRHLDQGDNGTREAEYDRLLASRGREAAYPLPTLWLAGRTPTGLRQVAERVVADALAQERIQFRPDMRNLIACLHAAGWQVWVVSASPREVIAAMANRVGIPRERVLAMRLKMADGIGVAELDGFVTMDEGKAEAVSALLPHAPTLALGDSPSDRAMLTLATHAILVDGHHPELRAHAAANGWWIQTGWRQTETA